MFYQIACANEDLGDANPTEHACGRVRTATAKKLVGGHNALKCEQSESWFSRNINSAWRRNPISGCN